MKKILVVDDNLATLQQIAAQLDAYLVLRAKSGAQALIIAAGQTPDLVLLDIDMPGMDGFETLTALRHIEALKRVPVIFLTGNHDTATQIRALQSGGVDFIKKPVSKGVLLHRLQLHLSLHQYQQSLEQTVQEFEDSIIAAFAELIECRDASNGGHVQRTRQYVAALGTMLLEANAFPESLDKEKLDMMVRAAPLHDIGKIGVSDTIICKPGRLTEEEYAVIKTHTVIGAKALESIYERMPTQYYMGYAILMALGHHERYDGKGYPNGLAGTDIPLCCRIMAVANVYDSLVVDSVYREALSHEKACAILAKGRGTEFDPIILDIFLERCNAFVEIARRFQQEAQAWAPKPAPAPSPAFPAAP
ncbi:MAG: putative cyclic di-GMP phosphodiesterase [Desulfovibrio sp.]